MFCGTYELISLIDIHIVREQGDILIQHLIQNYDYHKRTSCGEIRVQHKIEIHVASMDTNQGTHSNCIFKFPSVVPVRQQIVPVPIGMICDYYIHKTDLTDLSSFRKKVNFLDKNKNFFYI